MLLTCYMDVEMTGVLADAVTPIIQATGVQSQNTDLEAHKCTHSSTRTQGKACTYEAAHKHEAAACYSQQTVGMSSTRKRHVHRAHAPMKHPTNMSCCVP
jgi:hypothetical protein